VVSPIRVAGVADPTFEQTLVIRIVLDDGMEIAVQPVTIAADLGQRGPFEGEVSFNITDDRQALIQVYDQSARDGGVTHLASVGVRLSLSPPPEILPNEPRPEAIIVEEPAFGATISGGVAHVEGFGLASFEQTLVIEVQDVEGNVVGSMPIIVNAPDWGVPGPFSADVPYSVASEGLGRIVVIDPLPAFNGIGHISSVEITLSP
jgi:predicted secreted protein